MRQLQVATINSGNYASNSKKLLKKTHLLEVRRAHLSQSSVQIITSFSKKSRILAKHRLKAREGFIKPSANFVSYLVRRDDVHDDLKHIDDLIKEWLFDTRFLSSTSAIKKHSSFLALEKLGRKSVARVIQRMRAGDVKLHWFLILKAATEIDPVKPEHRGVLSAMTADWLKWAYLDSLSNARPYIS